MDDEASFSQRLVLCMKRISISTQRLTTFTNTQTMRSEYAKAKEAGEPYEIIFIDINLRGSDVDGLELVRQIRATMNGFAVLCVISTSNRPEEVAKAKANGADAFIVKTGDLAEFTKRLTGFKENYIDKRVKEFMTFGV